MKQILVVFDFQGVTSKQYDQVWDDLRASGNAHPKGLIYHVGAEKPNGGWIVTDVWESEDAFKEFGNTLMPLIAKAGIPMVQPQVYPVHYLLENAMVH